MSTQSDRLLSIALGAAVILQGGLLMRQSRLSQGEWLQVGLATFVLAILVQQLWRYRRILNVHVDMLLIMGAFGGLGMLLGSQWGGGSPHASHVMGTAAWWGMMIGMVAFGTIPAIPFSRCLQYARANRLLILVLLIDCAGMTAGMLAVHLVPMSHASRFAIILHHLLMMIGMLLGMMLAMVFRSRLVARIVRLRASARERDVVSGAASVR